jgi:fibronectin type 3 domain-containing protein
MTLEQMKEIDNLKRQNKIVIIQLTKLESDIDSYKKILITTCSYLQRHSEDNKTYVMISKIHQFLKQQNNESILFTNEKSI